MIIVLSSSLAQTVFSVWSVGLGLIEIKFNKFISGTFNPGIS